MKLLSKDINTSDAETKDTCNNDKYHTPEQALKILLGYDSFRAGQKSVIDSILRCFCSHADRRGKICVLSDPGGASAGNHLGGFAAYFTYAGSGQSIK